MFQTFSLLWGFCLKIFVLCCHFIIFLPLPVFSLYTCGTIVSNGLRLGALESDIFFSFLALLNYIVVHLCKLRGHVFRQRFLSFSRLIVNVLRLNSLIIMYLWYLNHCCHSMLFYNRGTHFAFWLISRLRHIFSRRHRIRRELDVAQSLWFLDLLFDVWYFRRLDWLYVLRHILLHSRSCWYLPGTLGGCDLLYDLLSLCVTNSDVLR